MAVSRNDSDKLDIDLSVKPESRVLYRAVSPEELSDIRQFEGFRNSVSLLEGKWFAERLEHAIEWGMKLYLSGGSFHIVQVKLSADLADRLFRLPNLDMIGPARYADKEMVMVINQENLGIIERH